MFSRKTPEVRAARRALDDEYATDEKALKRGDPAAEARNDAAQARLRAAEDRARAGGDTLGQRTGRGRT